jgi:hypothetical protein
MAKKSGGFYKNVLDSKSKNSILHSVYLLYIIFAIAIIDVFYLIISSKWIETSVFFAVGIVTSFFSKNMVVILTLAMVATFIFSNGAKSLEGFEDEGMVEEEMVEDEMVDEEMVEEEGKIDEGMDEEKMEKEPSGSKKVNIPGVTPFEIPDNTEISSKIEELMSRQTSLLAKMDEHKPMLESITTLGKSIGLVK